MFEKPIKSFKVLNSLKKMYRNCYDSSHTEASIAIILRLDTRS